MNRSFTWLKIRIKLNQQSSKDLSIMVLMMKRGTIGCRKVIILHTDSNLLKSLEKVHSDK